MNYQKIGNYSGNLYGEPTYQGIEYDWEVPDNLVVGSPGGVSSIHHHWTHGFNGRGNTSSDIYAGQGPRYNSGVYGNLYQPGQEAGQSMGYYPAAPDYKFWVNEQPGQTAYNSTEASAWSPMMTQYGEPGSYISDDKKKSMIEGFSSSEDIDDGFDVVESEDDDSQSSTRYSTKISAWALFLIFLFLSIIFFFWSQAGLLFLKQHFHNGRTPSWQRMSIYSLALTVVFVVILYMFGIPFSVVEVRSD
jgi:hypothetical protein